MVWYTSEAAEYPAALCEAWARDGIADSNRRDAEAVTGRNPNGKHFSLAQRPRQEPRELHLGVSVLIFRAGQAPNCEDVFKVPAAP